MEDKDRKIMSHRSTAGGPAEGGPPAPLRAEGARGPGAGSADLKRFLQKAICEEFRAALGEALQIPLAIRLCEGPRGGGLEECSWADFADSVEERSCCMSLAARPEGPAGAPEEEVPAGLPAAWLEVSPQIAFPIIDRLLGGSGKEWYVPCRACTAIERRLLRRVGEAVAEGLNKALAASRGRAGSPRWECASGADDMPEENQARAQSREQPERSLFPVFLAKFTLTMGRQAGALRLCLPKGLLAGLFPPASAGLQQAAGPAEQDGQGQPPFSEQRKRSRYPVLGPQAGPLELSVVVQDIHISREELSQIAEGDILMTDTAEDGEVLVRIGGIPRFYARLGVSNGRKAIQITRRIDERR